MIFIQNLRSLICVKEKTAVCKDLRRKQFPQQGGSTYNASPRMFPLVYLTAFQLWRLCEIFLGKQELKRMIKLLSTISQENSLEQRELTLFYQNGSLRKYLADGYPTEEGKTYTGEKTIIEDLKDPKEFITFFDEIKEFKEGKKDFQLIDLRPPLESKLISTTHPNPQLPDILKSQYITHPQPPKIPQKSSPLILKIPNFFKIPLLFYLPIPHTAFTSIPLTYPDTARLLYCNMINFGYLFYWVFEDGWILAVKRGNEVGLFGRFWWRKGVRGTGGRGDCV
ncbi:unnamed protein product [Moneuplotes crassus]|uniref:Rhodanese domain-containing protein n=1 Tax=Euplotes crassus TaxID=5936 RepID=A0AAD1XKC3_EUPCR|nr:unnamed protein product [Moneuplotes crassus]